MRGHRSAPGEPRIDLVHRIGHTGQLAPRDRARHQLRRADVAAAQPGLVHVVVDLERRALEPEPERPIADHQSALGVDPVDRRKTVHPPFDAPGPGRSRGNRHPRRGRRIPDRAVGDGEDRIAGHQGRVVIDGAVQDGEHGLALDAALGQPSVEDEAERKGAGSRELSAR